MAPFLYRKIGQPLLDDLREKVIVQRESVVLIAPRFGGKRRLMNWLFEDLQAEGRFHISRLNASPQNSVSNSEEFRRWLAAEVKEANAGDDANGIDDLAGDLFAPLNRLVARSGKPVILLVSNIDSLSQILARELLLKIRTLVEERKLIAVLSGEDILQKLVHGPASEFNCAYQYFLNGFDYELFARETRAYRTALGLPFADGEAATRRLYDLAGGHLSIMEILLRDIFKVRFECKRSLDSPVTLAEIPTYIGPDLLRQPPRVINNAPECWEDLKQLVHDDVSQISSNALEPSPLELAGVAVRDRWNIRISSPLLKNFLRTYYTNKRFGDLYVRKNDFDTAFAYYEQLSEEERVRPSNSDDRREVAFTITALAAQLHFVATKSPDEVDRLFFKISRFVLGFREVGSLEMDPSGRWIPRPFPGAHLSEETVENLNQLLPKSDPETGIVPITGDLSQFALAAIAPTERPDRFLAIVVCDQAAGRTISIERKRLSANLLSHFVEAYKQASQIVAARDHLETRDKHIKIANSIFDGLGSRAHNAEHVIHLAAQSLRSLGYRRVSFCLVDPEKKRIKGVWDESDDKSVDLAGLTDWSLDEPTADIQPYVIETKEPKIVPDADREPLVNPVMREKAGLKAFAVVPLLAQNGEAIGTMHVEKEDRSVPSREEVDDLAHFGRQLAIAIGQSERVNLQQGTLDKMVSAMLIVDSTRKLRYANQGAEETLGLKSGWRDQVNAESLSEEIIGKEAMALILESLGGQRRERRIGLPQDDGGACFWEALSDVIKDSHEQVQGAFIRIRDVAFPHRMFKAFNLIAEAKDKPSVLRQSLEAGRHLEFKWGRSYLVAPQNPDCLVSHDFFGAFPNDLQKSFREGEIKMPRRNTPGRESWRCFDAGDPVVFYFAPNRVQDSIYITQKGQEAFVVTNPRLQSELRKRPGDFWVDLPLRARNNQPIGKLTFEWSEDRWPREFDLLEVLAEMISRRLEAFQEREREEERLQAVRTQTAQKIMATVAHNIGTQLSALPILLTRYRLRENDLPALRDLNNRFASINQETNNLINRAKERLVGVSPRFSLLNLKDCLALTLRAYLEDMRLWRVECPYNRFEVQADGYLLKQALYELIQNSRDVAAIPEQLQITISLVFETSPEGKIAKIIYRDNGPGVPDKIKERIFEDFFTHHPGGKPGTGLGMGFVRRVAQAHGGDITERGIPGNGAEFVIAFPVRQAAGPMENVTTM